MVAQLERASDAIGLRVKDGPDHTEASIKASLPVRDRNRRNRIAVAFQVALQADLDHREPIASLPTDEPTKAADPARSNEFWDGGDIVSRDTVVTIWWDGAQYAVRARSV